MMVYPEEMRHEGLNVELAYYTSATCQLPAASCASLFLVDCLSAPTRFLVCMSVIYNPAMIPKRKYRPSNRKVQEVTALTSHLSFFGLLKVIIC